MGGFGGGGHISGFGGAHIGGIGGDHIGGLGGGRVGGLREGRMAHLDHNHFGRRYYGGYYDDGLDCPYYRSSAWPYCTY
jgi:hypothetical protein